jgi:hypothetical protein
VSDIRESPLDRVPQLPSESSRNHDTANAVIASIRTDETGGTACAAEATTANSDIDEERPNTS